MAQKEVFLSSDCELRPLVSASSMSTVYLLYRNMYHVVPFLVLIQTFYAIMWRYAQYIEDRTYLLMFYGIY